MAVPTEAAVTSPEAQPAGYAPKMRSATAKKIVSSAPTKKAAPAAVRMAHGNGTRATRGGGIRCRAAKTCGERARRPSIMATYSDQVTLQTGSERDVLVLAKTGAANEFPVERPGVIGVDRQTGNLVRLSPFPWKGADTDPPLQRWSWIQVGAARDERDVRPETMTVHGEVRTVGYVDAKDGWRLRGPFVRAHLRGSAESLIELARGRAASAGFVRPQPDLDVLQLPLRMRFLCSSDDCEDLHEFTVLDWALDACARATRGR